MQSFMWPRSNHTLFISVLLLAGPLMICWVCVCVCTPYLHISQCLSVYVSSMGLLSHLLLIHKMQTLVQPHTYTQTIRRKKKWLQKKPGMGSSPSSQTACLLVIARVIGCPLKQLKPCVHVFKRQCYVSACHLPSAWVLALWFSPTHAPFPYFSSSLSWVENYRRGTQWPRPGQLLCLAMGV